MSTRRALEKSGYAPSMKLDARRAEGLCIDTGAGHLFAGSVNFLPDKRMSVEAVVYSCGERKAVGKGSETGPKGSIQKLIRSTIASAAYFTRANPRTGSGSSAGDFVFLVDTSGSMATDLSDFAAAIGAVKDNMPASSRVGGIFLEAGGKQDNVPLSTDWRSFSNLVRSKRAFGDVTMEAVERALVTVEELREWRGDRRLIVLTDAATKGRRNEFEMRLRRLRSKGVQVSLLSLAGQDQESRLEWARLSRSLGLGDPAVAYGRRVGFLDGFSIYLVQTGGRFFRADKDVTPDIIRNNPRMEDLRAIETVQYPRGSLNLTDLPSKYAETERLKLGGLGPIVSGLEQRLQKEIRIGSPTKAGSARVLLKNQGQSFWISVSGDSARELSMSRGKSLYVGMSLKMEDRGGERLANDPDRVYIKAQGNVPRLLTVGWGDLLEARSINPEDIWFVLSEIKEVRDGTESHDIRE